MKQYLHYIASGKNGIYGREVFIKEAKEIGVNRSLPYFLIKKLKWGDRILLANFENRHAGETEYIIQNTQDKELFWNNENGYGDKDSATRFTEEEYNSFQLPVEGKWVKKFLKFSDGIANGFGYFVISGLNLKASPELKEKLYSLLEIVSSNASAIKVTRSCGSYILVGHYVVNNSLADIIEKAQILAEKMNEKVKYFISGKFYELNFKIEGVNFSRSIIEVDFQEIKNIKDLNNEVGFIQDYNKNTYIPKKERI